MKVKSESEVADSCLTLRDPMDCSPPGSSVHGIFQARVLEWGAAASPVSRLLLWYYHQFLPYCLSVCFMCLGDPVLGVQMLVSTMSFSCMDPFTKIFYNTFLCLLLQSLF